jgi:hypothetical protein
MHNDDKTGLSSNYSSSLMGLSLSSLSNYSLKFFQLKSQISFRERSAIFMNKESMHSIVTTLENLQVFQ